MSDGNTTLSEEPSLMYAGVTKVKLYEVITPVVKSWGTINRFDGDGSKN